MRWQYLKAGDSVDIIAPASHSPDLKLSEGLGWLTSLGLIPRVPHDLIDPDIFFASSLKQQLAHFKEALYSDSKAIWCLRGGYGSMRLIPYLEKMKPPKKAKLLIGFSDITSLHLYLNQKWKWPTLHGRTISQLGINHHSQDREELIEILFGRKKKKSFDQLKPLNPYAEKERTIKGKLVGGNLRILQSSLGTDWELEAKGKIVFVEDVSERGYSVDRMFEQLHQAKILHKGVKALIFGDFTAGDEKNGENHIHYAFQRFAQRVNYPVLMGLPCGHGEENFALPFNTKCELILGSNSHLICDYGGK